MGTLSELRSSIRQLNAQGLYRSAVTLCSFLWSARDRPDALAWSGGEASRPPQQATTVTAPDTAMKPTIPAAAAAAFATPAIGAGGAASAPASIAARAPPAVQQKEKESKHAQSRSGGANAVVSQLVFATPATGSTTAAAAAAATAAVSTPAVQLSFDTPATARTAHSSAAAHSAPAVGSIESVPPNSTTSNSFDLSLVEDCELYGDACVGTTEWRRAIAYFQRAADELTRFALARSSHLYPSLASAVADAEHRNAAIKVKLSQCLSSAGDQRNACAVLESIPQQHRSVTANIRLAELYEACSQPQQAIACYNAVLASNPLAIEASLALIRLGVATNALPLAAAASSSSSAPSAGAQRFPFLLPVLHSHELATRLHTHRSAVRAYGEVLSAFPRNSFAAVQLGLAQIQLNESADACTALEFAASIDEFCVDGMDALAYAYRLRGRTGDLAALTFRLLRVTEQRPEVWCAAALYSEQTAQRDTALKYADRALSIDKRHVNAHLIRGYILLSSGQLDASIASYVRAHELNKFELTAYSGLIDAYLSAAPEPRFRDALALARTALELMPKNPRALTLIGNVLATNKREGQTKAMKAFHKALSVDPNCVDAVLALSRLHYTQSAPPPDTAIEQLSAAAQAAHRAGTAAAIQVLSDFIRDSPRRVANRSGSVTAYTGQQLDVVHARLAQLFFYSARMHEALTHFQQALSLNPTCAAALVGSERLEAALKTAQDEATAQAAAAAANNSQSSAANNSADMSDSKSESNSAQVSGAASPAAATPVR